MNTKGNENNDFSHRKKATNGMNDSLFENLNFWAVCALFRYGMRVKELNYLPNIARFDHKVPVKN